jgi:CRISPR-associated exonuclease Cas4
MTFDHNRSAEWYSKGGQLIARIPVSWLHSYGYCEYQIYLEHVRGVEAEETPEMQEVREAHAAMDEAHKAAAELELDVDEALTKAQEEQIVLSAREVQVKGKQLVGCIDEIVFLPDRIMIVDDKPGDIAWPSSKLQAWGYCLTFEEQYEPNMPIIAGIRNRDTGYEIWASPYTRRNREEVLRAVSRIRQLLDGEAIPVGCRNPKKCRACRFNGSCDVRSV